MAYYDKARDEQFKPKKNQPSVLGGIFSKKSVTYTDPQGVQRTATNEPQSGRIVPQGSDPSKFVRVRDMAPKPYSTPNVKTPLPSPSPVKTPGSKSGSATKNYNIRPVRPAQSAGASKAAAPATTVPTKQVLPQYGEGPSDTTLKVGGAIGAAGAVYLASKLAKPTASTPSAKANKIPKAPVERAPASALGDLIPKDAKLRAGKMAKDYREKMTAAKVAAPEVKGTTAVQEGSAAAAGASKVTIKRPSKAATRDSVQTKAQVTPEAPKTIEQKPSTTLKSQPTSAVETGKPQTATPQASSISKSYIEKLRESRKAMIASGQLQGTGATQQSSAPVQIKRPPKAKAATPQPDVNAVARATESPTHGGVDPSVAKVSKPASIVDQTKSAWVTKKQADEALAARGEKRTGSVIVRPSARPSTKPVGAGVPLPVTTVPAPTTIPKESLAKEVGQAKAQQDSSTNRTRPGKQNQQAKDLADKIAERNAMMEEAPPTEKEVPKTSLQKTKRAQKIREQFGSAPTRIDPVTAAKQADRKAAIEAHMKTKGYTKVVGQGEEAKTVKVEPTTETPPVKVKTSTKGLKSQGTPTKPLEMLQEQLKKTSTGAIPRPPEVKVEPVAEPTKVSVPAKIKRSTKGLKSQGTQTEVQVAAPPKDLTPDRPLPGFPEKRWSTQEGRDRAVAEAYGVKFDEFGKRIGDTVKDVTKYSPEATRAALGGGKFWWRNVGKVVKEGAKGIPGLIALDVAKNALPQTSKFSGLKKQGSKEQSGMVRAATTAKENLMAGTALAIAEKAAPTLARGALKYVVPPVALAATAYDAYKLETQTLPEVARQGKELFSAISDKRRAEKYTQEHYGTEELATKTRKAKAANKKLLK